jgi:hypothetical protein
MAKKARIRRVAKSLDEGSEEFRWSQGFSGSEDAAFESELKKRFEIVYTFLSEEQWEEVSSIAGLPLHARFEVNIALKRYWYAYLNESVSPDTLPEIENVHSSLESALNGLLTLSRNPDLFKGQIIHFDRSAIEQREMLEGTVKSILRAMWLLENAERRLTKGKGARAYGPLYELIHRLDFIMYKCVGGQLKNSDKKIQSPMASGSPKEFVRAILKIAHLQVKDTTVDTMLKRYVNDRDRQGREYGAEPV